MTDKPASPAKARTGVLWALLAVFLVVGAVGSATVVYGLLGLIDGELLGAAAVVGGAIVAALAWLFMMGILYRVDRYRGALGRRVELFE